LGIAEGCRKGISAEAPWEDFSEYFQVILELLGKLDLGLVLMIDEFDKLQEGIDNGVTSPQIPENIRYLIQSHPRFVAILTGSRRMQRLRHEYWSALYGLGNRVGVTALDPESARNLVKEPVKGKLTYTDEAVDMITNLTARQPFLIQYLCNRVFELVSHLGIHSVGKKLVEEAADSFVRDNEHFASLWDYAVTDQRRFLIDICHRHSAGPDPVTFGFLQQQLANEGIEISDGDLDGDLKFLQELEIIDFAGVDGGGVYRLTVPLMGQWIDQQQEYAALRDKARKEQENTQ
jgi:type I restriction enzyme M protein